MRSSTVHSWDAKPPASAEDGDKFHNGFDGYWIRVNGEWVSDEARRVQVHDYHRHRADLREALVTRVLSDEEMVEVGRAGARLIISDGQSYNAAEKEAEFQSMLMVQMCWRIKPPS